MSSSGLSRLADGKATFAALKQLLEEYQQSLADDTFKEETYSEKLLEALLDGVDCSAIEFEDDDDGLVIAWATAAHDLESNKYRASTLKDLVAVAALFNKRQPGGSWEATRLTLERVYGPRRRMLVYRMIIAAQMLEPDVLEALEAAKLSPYLIHENKYFVGTGPHGACQSG